MCCKWAVIWLVLCLPLPFGALQAQPNLPLARAWADRPTLFATVNAERYQPSGSFLYAQLQQAVNQAGVSGIIGYEQRLTRHWFVGGSLMPTVNDVVNRFSYGLHLSHSGRIGKWQLLKQATYVLQADRARRAAGTTARRDYFNSLGFMAALARNFPVSARQTLRTVLSYQASVFPGSIIHPRTIDHTQAQAEIAWFPKETYSIGLFFAQNTNYFIALGRFDANGNVIEPERRLNLNTAFIGLRLHLLLNLSAVKDREQMRILAY